MCRGQKKKHKKKVIQESANRDALEVRLTMRFNSKFNHLNVKISFKYTKLYSMLKKKKDELVAHVPHPPIHVKKTRLVKLLESKWVSFLKYGDALGWYFEHFLLGS